MLECMGGTFFWGENGLDRLETLCAYAQKTRECKSSVAVPAVIVSKK